MNISWPPRFPDLIPIDFSIGDLLKNKFITDTMTICGRVIKIIPLFFQKNEILLTNFEKV